ncbi:MAG TPA: Ig-like domain-containing protein, partial [Anaeromyxobacter sp.]
AAGAQGDPQTDYPSHDPSGQSGTGMPIDACETDLQCGGAAPACDTTQDPNVCVACTADSYCSGATPICDLASRRCVATTSIAPAAQDRTTVAGTGVPFAMTLSSHLTSADTYDLDVPGGACGWAIALLDGAGAVVATRDGAGVWAGGDTNGNGLPDLGPTAANGATPFQLRLTPPPGAPIGASCTAILTAAGQGSGLWAQASATAHVGAAATYTPDFTGGAAKTVGSGSVVNFPGVVQNNGAAAAAFALSAAASSVPDAGALAPMVFYSDPNADGDPSDGAVITGTASISPFGGTTHVVLQVRASTAGGAALPAGTSISITANAGTAVQLDEAKVGYLATFADAGGAVSTRTFAPCATAYLRATKLPPGPEYLAEWYAKASPVRGTDVPVRTVSPWLVMGGAASDQLALGAAAAGPWTIVLVQRSGGVDTVLDQLPFTVERAGVFGSLAAPARIPLGAALDVSASVRNDGAVASLAGTSLSYAVTDGSLWMNGSGAFAADPAARARRTSDVTVPAGATANDAFTVLDPGWPAPGRYRVDAEWQLSCGTTPLIASATTQLDVVPLPPVLDMPANGALVATATPTIGGSARPSASVALSIDGAARGPAVADASGRFAYALLAGEALGQGVHTVTAVQTENGVASDPSAAVSFTVDTVPPAVAIAFPADGALLGAAQAPGGAVTVSGTGEAGASVSVTIGATTVAATSSGGTWTASFTLADGPHAAAATATDAAGNSASATAAFTLDTVAPAAPV